jgi:hypothetical protein
MSQLKEPFASVGPSIVHERGAAGGHGGPKRLADAARQVAHLPVGQLECPQERMDSRPKKGLVAIDISQAADDTLIQQQRLDLPFAAGQVAQNRNADGQGVGPKQRQPLIAA